MTSIARWVIHKRGVGKDAKSVSLALGLSAQYGTEDICPGLRRIARDFDIARDTAKGYLARAEEIGTLVMTQPARQGANGVGEPAHYRVNLEWSEVAAMAESMLESVRQ